MVRVAESIVIKLGGSVITHKDRPLALRNDAIEALSRVLAYHPSRKIIIHGGGSFGHYYAKKAGLSTECSAINDLEAVFLTRKSMFELNQHIVNSLSKNGLYPYIIAPYIMSKNHSSMRLLLSQLLDRGFTPLFFGDVVPCRGGFKIVSGDDISYNVCSVVRPSRMIFCIDVDGIYPSTRMEGQIVHELSGKVLENIVGYSNKFDVTGGIIRKLKIAYKISKLGIDVFFVNGLNSDSVLKALNGVYGVGTCMRGTR